MTSFKQRIAYLVEVGELPRQSVCFQFLMLLYLAHKGLSDETVRNVDFEGAQYYESLSLRECMANAKSASNAHKGIHALYDSGFIEKLVIDSSGQKVVTDKFSRNAVTIYWRLSLKGLALFS
ncbi:hypothetical protein [Vibrio scophthalmi]|uniref:Uncharacterized protein n=1 Tax=Vibrio scophthalmi TaxID=45658 RepID=A0A1C7FHW1_9VIBR|nr:hypothetical protein [Vibrio scophthalmi]ANU39486.1 hypothetical protein VSVS05_04451 [Vibrio scophthalmi]